MPRPSNPDHALLRAVFAKMDVPAMSISVGLISSLALFMATAILLIQTVPENYPVGPHIIALADYLPGYSVSWLGSLAGAFYGFVAGALLGLTMAILWNLSHYLAIGLLLMKSSELID